MGCVVASEKIYKEELLLSIGNSKIFYCVLGSEGVTTVPGASRFNYGPQYDQLLLPDG